MSTGAPVSSVETLPPAPHGHGFGHSRGHGHSRSKRWSQPPVGNALSSTDFAATQLPSSTTSTGSTQPNSFVSDSSLHNHQHSYSYSLSHSHSHSHASIHDSWNTCRNETSSHHGHTHEESETAASKARAMPVAATGSASSSNREAISGALMALPWVAISWYYQRYARWDSTAKDEHDSKASASGCLDHLYTRMCSLTAITMIMLGVGQIIQWTQQGGTHSAAKVPKLSTDVGVAALKRMCAIALPIYASLNVSGYLVAFGLLSAAAAGVPTFVQDRTAGSNAQGRFSEKRGTVALLGVVTLLGFLGLNTSLASSPLFGYISLLLSIFVIRPPFEGTSQPKAAYPVGLGISASGQAGTSVPQDLPSGGLSASPNDGVLTLIVGLLFELLIFVVSGGPSLSATDALYLLITAGTYAISLLFLSPSNLQSPHKSGLAIGTACAAFLCALPPRDDMYVVYASRCILAMISFFAARYDDRQLRLAHHSHQHHHAHSAADTSRATKLLLLYSEPYPLLYSILKESDSRRIFYFMTLNFAFMLVQLSYGFITGSLGLLSDSIHMFFDCLALVVGLCAAVMSKWPPSARFPYGYGKVDTLSGFANGIFLMIISIEIIYEAVERLSSGSQMHRLGELLAVSVAGLMVNLVGIMAFDHGHAHGHDHGGHSHSHGNENMHGIFLHILADTLGSVAVVISTILVHFSGWAGYDPIASCLIAILIFASAVPLVSSTAKTLLLALPADVEYNWDTLYPNFGSTTLERLPGMITITVMVIATAILTVTITVIVMPMIMIMHTVTIIIIATTMGTAILTNTITNTIILMRNTQVSSGSST
ncbi:metal cation transporter MSC2 [Aspergillus clavatus NRRL 1]|uniref:Zinc transporter n=1 Tax=Aspergillus clavatus (strain ATCC 1007 / CBS 513.65 / DSM 816 / NCTC 3887 / NRRL 1 / QM 1276 / 107) TaxID=344612 RepID=A1CUN6_ASPCL|nr:cation efflux protein/ zinc transporter [Aspergillus clavatus NRRL 1]EAW07023.1 cation efflux protein/ zinc transporter [Aspergillus clavatus NRRL 1]